MKVALIQMTSVLDPQENLDKIHRLLADQSHDFDILVLPEVFYSMSDGQKPTPYLVKDKSEHLEAIRSLATQYDCGVIGGSVAYEYSNEVRNRALNFSSKGELLGEYDKKNLFKVKLGDTNLDESRVYSSGSELCDFEYKSFHFGISICFDLRFPELYREYFKRGANVLTVSSAFTVPTGKAHWESLVRARAIENQSYVLAANQWGKHNDRIETYGHSMIVDPWGKIIASIGEGEGVLRAELNLDFVQKIRNRMDVLPR